MKVNQRDIILVNFPFSDLTEAKVKPALVISGDAYNSTFLNAVVLAITSNLSPQPYKIFISNNDLEKGRLPVKSAIRVDKPFSVLQQKVLMIQARLELAKFQKIKPLLEILMT